MQYHKNEETLKFFVLLTVHLSIFI